MPTNRNNLAYFITFTTYGTWLHGDERGSVDDEHNIPGTPFAKPAIRRDHANRSAMKWPELNLNAKARGVVDRTVREVCVNRAWALHALNVRSNHLHIVVSANDPAVKVMTDLKAWCTRRLREAECLAKDAPAWTEGGSKRKLNTPESLRAAVHYVLHEQGPDLPME